MNFLADSLIYRVERCNFSVSLRGILQTLAFQRKLRSKEVYLHREETISLAKKLSKDDVSKWLLEVGYYPEPYVLPPFFEISTFRALDPYFSDKKYEGGGIKWVEQVKVAYPNEGFTSRVFSLMHPKYYHDLVNVCVDNFDMFIQSYKSKRISSYTFPIPLDSKNPGTINAKRSERQIYEYIEAAERSLLLDSQDYKYVVIADIKQFYPSIYTHAISWAIHSKVKARKYVNKPGQFSLIGNKIDKLLQCSNDGKTNGIAVGPAISDVVSEWMLNAVDVIIDKNLPGRAFGIRFKDDYRIVCDTEDEARQIIEAIHAALQEFDLSLSEEKTVILELPDGMYRPWMLEYDQFQHSILGDDRNEAISFKSYEMMQRKIFMMNKDYGNKGITEKFLGRLIGDDFRLLVNLNTNTQKKLFIAHLTRLVKQKPKVIGQVLGILDLILDKDTKPMIEASLNSIMSNNLNNEFILCWILYFKKIHNGNYKMKVAVPKKKDMPLLQSLHDNKQRFFSEVDGIRLVQNIKNIEMSLVEHTALFKKGVQ